MIIWACASSVGAEDDGGDGGAGGPGEAGGACRRYIYFKKNIHGPSSLDFPGYLCLWLKGRGQHFTWLTVVFIATFLWFENKD